MRCKNSDFLEKSEFCQRSSRWDVAIVPVSLGEDLLDFTTIRDLLTWLDSFAVLSDSFAVLSDGFAVLSDRN